MKILIDTDWFAMIQDLAPDKRQEVINALLEYPNGHSDTQLWNKVIYPALEKGRIAYYNKISHLKNQKPQKTAKNFLDTSNGTIVDTSIDTSNGTTIREDISNINNNNNINNINNTGIDNKGGVGEKEGREYTPEEKAANKEKAHQIIQQIAQVAKRQPDQVSITYNNVIVHGLLGMFLKDNFGEDTVTRARDWMIDHVPGQNWNADKIIKLMCRWTGKTPFLEINKWADFCEKHKKQNKNQNNS